MIVSRVTPLVLLLLAAGPATHAFRSADGRVALRYPAGVVVGHDFGGHALMSGGWRAMWDGSPPGPGTGVVSLSVLARPDHDIGQVTEMLRVGVSRDPRVVASCGTAGVRGANTRRLPNRTLGGHRWTVWGNGDAGMSQQVDATDWRTVVDGACYAADRISYAVKAAPAPPAGVPGQAAAKARIDAALATLTVGGRR